jgi:hypothetical protein
MPSRKVLDKKVLNRKVLNRKVHAAQLDRVLLSWPVVSRAVPNTLLGAMLSKIVLRR